MNHYAKAIDALATIANPTRLEIEFCKKHPADFVRAIFEAEPKPKEPTFRVVLNHNNGKLVPVIMAIREFTGLSLKEAKDLYDGCPSTIAVGLSSQEATGFAHYLSSVGADASIKKE